MARIVYPDADDTAEALDSGGRRERLEQLGEFEVHQGPPKDDADLIARVGDAKVLLLGWELPAGVMEAAPELELVSFLGTGVGSFVDLDEAAGRGITVCNTPGYANNAVAEQALALLLALADHVPAMDRTVRSGDWAKQGRVAVSAWGRRMELRGKRMGLVGYGGIGRRFGELAAAIGMDVSVWTRSPEKHRAAGAGVSFVTLEQLLRESDAISVHVALTEETTGLIGADEIAALKPGALLVNTARAEVFDETALLAGLRSGQVGGAGMDVFASEPLPDGHPFTELGNVVLSPHTGFNTPEASFATYDIAIDNIASFLSGNPQNVVAAPAGPE